MISRKEAQKAQKIWFGCNPSSLLRLFAAIKKIADLTRRTLVEDQIYLKKN